MMYISAYVSRRGFGIRVEVFCLSRDLISLTPLLFGALVTELTGERGAQSYVIQLYERLRSQIPRSAPHTNAEV